jgi:hypothetical protein
MSKSISTSVNELVAAGRSKHRPLPQIHSGRASETCLVLVRGPVSTGN